MVAMRINLIKMHKRHLKTKPVLRRIAATHSDHQNSGMQIAIVPENCPGVTLHESFMVSIMALLNARVADRISICAELLEHDGAESPPVRGFHLPQAIGVY